MMKNVFLRQIFCTACVTPALFWTLSVLAANRSGAQEPVEGSAPAMPVPAVQSETKTSPTSTTQQSGEAPLVPASAGAEAGESEKPTPAAAPRGRLPRFYAKLVTQAQRLEIYRIQSTYRTQIQTLESQLEQLRMARDQSVEGVLTEEQRARLLVMMQPDAQPASAALEKAL